jgi:hypothetical protein
MIAILVPKTGVFVLSSSLVDSVFEDHREEVVQKYLGAKDRSIVG